MINTKELGGLPTVVEYTDQDLDRIMKMQGKEEIKDISEILDTNLEYNKLMMKLELYKDDEEKIEKLMEEIIAYRTKAKKVMKAKNLKYLQEKEELRNSLPKTRTTYATFHTLAKLAERAAMYPDKKFIIFIDEINRSEHAVMQELMNLILNRSINGFDLPENVYVVGAANPSASFEDFRDTEYQVNDFDQAQLARLTLVPMETGYTEWLSWASAENDETGLPNIVDEVTEFIASQTEMLLVTKGNDDVLPNPRSWSRVSRTMEVVKENKAFDDSDFYNKIVGDIGSNAATTFVSFLRERKNPLISPEEIFKGEFTEEKKDRVRNESYPRKLTILNNSLRYVNTQFKDTRDKKAKEKLVNTFVQLIGEEVTPAELMVTIMHNLMNNKAYTKLNDTLLENQDYLTLYFTAFRANA